MHTTKFNWLSDKRDTNDNRSHECGGRNLTKINDLKTKILTRIELEESYLIAIA